MSNKKIEITYDDEILAYKSYIKMHVEDINNLKHLKSIYYFIQGLISVTTLKNK